MTSQEAYDVWASGRGVSQEIDAANWQAYQEALEAEGQAQEAPEAEELPFAGIFESDE